MKLGDRAGPLLKHLPNAMTLARLVLAPVVAYAVWETNRPGGDYGAHTWAVAAAVLFVVAALTDLFDGIAARAFDADSKFGRIIDPIADKALVGLPLIALAGAFYQRGVSYWLPAALAVGVIVGRDLMMTYVRLSASDGEGPRVSRLAKWKTALELIVVGTAVLLPLLPKIPGQDSLTGDLPLMILVWMTLLVVAAGLSAYTAVRYFVAK